MCTVSPSSLVYIRDHIRINEDIRALLASISDRDSAELQSSFSRISGGFQEDFKPDSNEWNCGITVSVSPVEGTANSCRQP